MCVSVCLSVCLSSCQRESSFAQCWGLFPPTLDAATLCVGVLAAFSCKTWHCWFHWNFPTSLAFCVGEEYRDFPSSDMQLTFCFFFHYSIAAYLTFENISTEMTTLLPNRIFSFLVSAFGTIIDIPGTYDSHVTLYTSSHSPDQV